MLAELAGTSTRHLSFIETGRGHPSRGLLLQLAAELEIPLRVRNGLLEAAGYSPQFGETGLSDPEMEQVRRVLDFILASSMPYPAMVLDQYWNIILSNPSFIYIVQEFASKPQKFLNGPMNLMQVILSPDGLRPYITNGADFVAYMVGRLRRSLNKQAVNEELEALLEEITCYEGAEHPAGQTEASLTPQLLMPIHIKRCGAEIQLFTTTATIGTPKDITLQELFVECAFPANSQTEAFFQKAVSKKSRGADRK